MEKNRLETIVAIATAEGVGAIAVIRVSGPYAIEICERLFESPTHKKLRQCPSQSLHFGTFTDGTKAVDEVLVSVFHAPKSYTGENMVEISCHGSPYIQQKIVSVFLKNGCRTANPGEFTQRAFLNGKIDLSQAEAVSDLIASEHELAQQTALKQIRKGYGSLIKTLRDGLIQFAALVELELDFSEEDVAFADRKDFEILLGKTEKQLRELIGSFESGNVIKNGIHIAILGKPNVGKSTLLNAFLKDDKAIVSNIPGTTRDTIEDVVNIDGLTYRFIDTAGLRETNNAIERIGIQKSYEKAKSSACIFYLIDAHTLAQKSKNAPLMDAELLALKKAFPERLIFVIINKIDCMENALPPAPLPSDNVFYISAKTGMGIDKLTKKLTETMKIKPNGNHIVSNIRHFEALGKALEEIEKVKKGLKENLSNDLLSIDLRQALYYMGLITGEITTDDLLENIFMKFCIGK